MSLFLHELTHLTLSLLAGYIAWKIFYLKNKKNLFISFLTGLIGGFFIDLDHLFDYFLAFGFRFRLDYFLKGYQFLKSDKIYIPLHSFEIVIILFIIYYLLSIGYKNFLRFKNFKNFKNFITLKTLIFAFSLSLLFHIAFDIVENELPPSTYSFIYRISKNFELKNLVYLDHYPYHLEQKKKIIFDN